MLSFETNIFFDKGKRNLFARPITKLFSYMMIGIFKRYPDKQTGNEEYPPIPIINFGFIFGTFNFLLVKLISRTNVLSDFISYSLAIIVSYSLFELIRKLAKFYFKKEALGQGDSKLIAMTSLWLGPLGTILSVGVSYITAAAFLLFSLGIKIIKKDELIPFAPFLSFGALLVWYFGNDQIIKIIYG